MMILNKTLVMISLGLVPRLMWYLKLMGFLKQNGQSVLVLIALNHILKKF
ncbi:hypothetical protein Thiosp_00564 [Thiorhodovibrio litoralis]|nr:hypothetical protein Thiosp_00564 [Thiorhodovibrio litoralis]